MMNAQFDDAIRILRDAANWNLCRENLSILASTVTSKDAVHIVVELIRSFLLQFPESRIDDNPFKEVLSMTAGVEEINDLAILSQRLQIMLYPKAESPGVNNFTNAMKKIGRWVEFNNATEEHIAQFVDIVSAIILAIEDYQWGTQYPDLWQESFEHKTKESFFIRAHYFVTNPEVISLNKTLWNRVADAIEGKMQ